jgi:glycosyltransferase involved in cell wall biosynthesis
VERNLGHLSCGVVIIALNEENAIAKCLGSLRNQTVPVFLVVVNDGSTDRTAEIASKFADVVVNLPHHKESWTGRPELARVFNAGFRVLQDIKTKYVMVSGADDVYPSDYVDKVMTRMISEDVVLASGVAEGEISRSLSPRGGGRLLDADWFRSVGFRYPENYGFEVYLVYKALSEGRDVAVFPDLKFGISRKTHISKRKAFLWGSGMKALNYWWPYAIGRSVLAGIKHPANGLAMLKGYLSSAPRRYNDIKGFVHEFQKHMLIRRLLEIL